jgi:hypothetical protein
MVKKLIEKRKSFNLQKHLIYSFFQPHINQCESFDVWSGVNKYNPSFVQM